nr:dihydrofolate reductase [uncultured bacterium]
MTISLIAAVARNGVIGSDGQIPWRLPGELPRFKALTTGHVLVMGRKTFDSIGKPLPGRTTIVVTRNADWQPATGPHPDVIVATSTDEALARAAAMGGKVFVAGGGEIYRETIGEADELLISWVDAAPDGDATFPTFGEPDWELVETEQHDGWTTATYTRPT